MVYIVWATHVLQGSSQRAATAKAGAKPQKRPKFGLRTATRTHEVETVSNRTSECYGDSTQTSAHTAHHARKMYVAGGPYRASFSRWTGGSRCGWFERSWHKVVVGEPAAGLHACNVRCPPMVPETSTMHLWPTPYGGNLSVYYDLPSVSNDDSLDTLWGTAEILVRAAQAQWSFATTPATLGSGFSLRPVSGSQAFFADAKSYAPQGALDGLAARLNFSGVLSAGLNVDLLVAFDPALILIEALVIFFVGAPLAKGLSKRATQGSGAYQDFVAACKSSGLSLTEIGVGVTLGAGLILFDIFVSLSEDDLTDTLGYGVLFLVIATFALWGLAVDTQAYYTLCCVGSGDLTTRLVLTDALNNGLCALRIFFCWVRYLFYDFQVEAVDLAFHYTDVSNEIGPLTLLEGGAWFSPEPTEGGLRPVWAATSSVWVILVPVMDVATTLLQLLLGLFKFAIALFLLWLLVDLFVLRPLALSETAGLLKKKA